MSHRLLATPIVRLLRARRYYGAKRSRGAPRRAPGAKVWQVNVVSYHFSVAGAVAAAARKTWGRENYPIIEANGSCATLPEVRRDS